MGRYNPGLLSNLTLIIFFMLASGCSSINYYQHLLKGHLSLLSDRRPIEDVLKDNNTNETTKHKLGLILEARAFAQSHLGLKVGDHYTQYVDLKRNFVIWNIFAAPELSLTPKTWCYPILGCMGYRGYYTQSQAMSEAEALKQEGLDTYVGGVNAYSTLGWFEDPVLSNFLRYPDERLVGLIFHELAHQQVYIKNDTVFNESFATAVELEGLRLWFQSKDEDKFEAYAKQNHVRQTFVNLINDTREELSNLYSSNQSDQSKRNNKRIILENLKAKYLAEVEKGNLSKASATWFDEINNAKLNTVAFYHDWVPAFRQAFKKQGNNWPAFYEWVAKLGKQPKSIRNKTLQNLQQAN